MRYNREIRRALYRCPPVVLDQLRNDFRFVERDIENGDSWENIKRKMVMRMWLGDSICKWSFWGGTNVVSVDKNIRNREPDKSWVNKIRNAYEQTTERTNRRIFGRRYFRKVAYPTSLVFYERGDITDGRHIHTLHHFPSGTSDKTENYLTCFTNYWNSHQINKGVGRTFWFDQVKDQDEATRYATKKMTTHYDFGWFPVG